MVQKRMPTQAINSISSPLIPSQVNAGTLVGGKASVKWAILCRSPRGGVLLFVSSLMDVKVHVTLRCRKTQYRGRILDKYKYIEQDPECLRGYMVARERCTRTTAVLRRRRKTITREGLRACMFVGCVRAFLTGKAKQRDLSPAFFKITRGFTLCA